MIEEFTALQASNTWDLVPHLSDGNVVTGKWVFHHKFHLDGSHDRYKARWGLRGDSLSSQVLTSVRLSVPW
jgi:hypothetical protein